MTRQTRLVRRLVASLALACIALSGACARPQTGRTPTRSAPSALAAGDAVRIGAWNMLWLGTPERRDGDRPPDMADFAAYIDAADVDVLAVSEVAWTHGDASSKRNARLDELMPLLDGRVGGTWRYRLFEQRGFDAQLTGVIWNGARLMLVDVLRIGVPEEVDGLPIWNRVPHAAFFSAGDGLTDFALIPVHMKSNYRREGQPDPLEKRVREARELLADLPEVMQTFGSERDIVIIGDTNCITPDERPAELFYTWTCDGPDAYFTQLGGDVSTYLGRDGALDRAFVPAAQPEFADSGFEVLDRAFLRAHGLDRPSEADVVAAYSDHWMIVTSLHVRTDDDGAAQP